MEQDEAVPVRLVASAERYPTHGTFHSGEDNPTRFCLQLVSFTVVALHTFVVGSPNGVVDKSTNRYLMLPGVHSGYNLAPVSKCSWREVEKD